LGFGCSRGNACRSPADGIGMRLAIVATVTERTWRVEVTSPPTASLSR
jgi:hypothetical protein